MSVIGFDIGSESCVIATARRGVVDVLSFFNGDESKSETPAVVSFGEKQRFFGSSGAAFATTNPKSTISVIKRLIGKLYKQVEEDLKLLPFVTREGPRGGILIELEYMKTTWTFTPVEILGMLFKHLKELTEKNLGFAIVDCVIGIPTYFTDLQRRMYLDAAQIAGLKPLRLMHDGTAIALGYGMYMTDFFDSGPTNVMFVDIGHCDTQVTLAAFEPGKMKILSHSFDQNLGGRDFDEVLFHHFAAKFNAKYEIDIYADACASTRLRASCKKVETVLSANAEAPLIIECLIGDTDVAGSITREEFENLSSKLLERVTIPCSMALKNAGLSVDKIHTIKLVGSGSRMPAIMRILTKFFEKEPMRTLNANECVARGCALRCAMLSSTLMVHDYKIEDSFPYSIVMPSAQGECVLFPKGSLFPSEKILRHKGTNLFHLEVTYINERDLPAGISHKVGGFGIGYSEPSDAENLEIEVRVKINGHGIVEIDSGKIVKDTRPSGRSVLWKIIMADSRMLNLPISDNLVVTTTNDELHQAKEKEKTLAEQDMKTSGANNNLQKTKDLLYEDNDDDSTQNHTQRLKDLKKEVHELRSHMETQLESERRAREAMQEQMKEEMQQQMAEFKRQFGKYPGDKEEKVKYLCTEAAQWLRTFPINNRLPPKILSTEIIRVTDVFESNCESIIRSIPHPPREEESHRNQPEVDTHLN